MVKGVDWALFCRRLSSSQGLKNGLYISLYSKLVNEGEMVERINPQNNVNVVYGCSLNILARKVDSPSFYGVKTGNLPLTPYTQGGYPLGVIYGCRLCYLLGL